MAATEERDTLRGEDLHVHGVRAPTRRLGERPRGEHGAWREVRATLVGVAVLAFVASPALVAAPALAQDNAQEKAAAEALFDEGRELLGQGQYEAACQRFEQSEAIDPGVGTLLYLGDCYERLGRMASAWAMYREAESSARATRQNDRAEVAHERWRRVAPNLSRVAIMVAAENRIEGFELVINGRIISPALYGTSFPIDAGRYQLVARAPGRTGWTAIFDVKPGGDQQLVQVPALPELAPALEAPGTEAATPGMAVTAPDGAQDATLAADAGHGYPPELWLGMPRQQTAGLFIAGGGVIVLGAGGVFGLLAQRNDDASRERCTPSCLSLEDAEKNEDARRWATLANVSYAVGGVALATGAVLFLTSVLSGDSQEARPALSVTPQLGRGSQSFVVEGSF